MCSYKKEICSLLWSVATAVWAKRNVFSTEELKGEIAIKKMLTLGHVFSAEIKPTRNYTSTPFPLTSLSDMV